MKFLETPLQDVWVIDLDPLSDERGFFARSWCHQEFVDHSLEPELVQCNISFNHKKGTVRGMHFQAAPHEECKVVRCTRGAILDLVVDLRPHSPTFKKTYAVELSADNHRMLYIPKGLAHGFQTLQDRTEVFYQMSSYFHKESAQGVRWDDPAFGIKWPLPVTAISEKDLSYPDFEP